MSTTPFDRWTQRIEDPIYQELTALYHNRYIWKSVLAMLEQNPDAVFHSAVNGWLSRMYSTTQAVGIRRQASTGAGEVTLANVLKQIEASPRQVTLDLFLSRTQPELNEHGEITAHWKANWQYGDSKFIDVARVAADRRTLEQKSAAVRKHVNKRMAHRDKVVKTPPLTYDDINGALDTLGDIFKRYYRLFTGKTLWQLTPLLEAHWIEAFQFQWATPAFAPPDESGFG